MEMDEKTVGGNHRGTRFGEEAEMSAPDFPVTAPQGRCPRVQRAWWSTHDQNHICVGLEDTLRTLEPP